jgi:uncharacterized protein YdeI (YjbR/CyaY-like superfamily)
MSNLDLDVIYDDIISVGNNKINRQEANKLMFRSVLAFDHCESNRVDLLKFSERLANLDYEQIDESESIEKAIAELNILQIIKRTRTLSSDEIKRLIDIIKKGVIPMDKKPVVVPEELTAVMETDIEAKAFFENLTDGYKRGSCDWVGGAKQAATRQIRADKALIMLQNKQKTLKT